MASGPVLSKYFGVSEVVHDCIGPVSPSILNSQQYRLDADFYEWTLVVPLVPPQMRGIVDPGRITVQIA